MDTTPESSFDFPQCGLTRSSITGKLMKRNEAPEERPYVLT